MTTVFQYLQWRMPDAYNGCGAAPGREWNSRWAYRAAKRTCPHPRAAAAKISVSVKPPQYRREICRLLDGKFSYRYESSGASVITSARAETFSESIVARKKKLAAAARICVCVCVCVVVNLVATCTRVKNFISF